MILAGDIGGTNTRLAYFDRSDLRHPRVQGKYPSRSHTGLWEIVGPFIQTHRLEISAACFGVAGPVRNGRCEATNLPWVVDAHDLAVGLGTERVWVINDLEANAFGISVLPPEDFCTLAEGVKGASGNAAVISAGTGLGEAGIYWDGARFHPFASEGGHATWAPRDEREIELLRWLQKQFGHASAERVVSGPGLVNLYRFFVESGRDEPDWLAQELRAGDPAAVISQAALAHRSPLCEEALDLFVSLYGAEAADLALAMMATAGVYIGGGIAPKIRDKMLDGTFMRAFIEKGRMKALLEQIPVRIILNDQTALFGAAECAAVRGGLL